MRKKERLKKWKQLVDTNQAEFVCAVCGTRVADKSGKLLNDLHRNFFNFSITLK